MVAIYYTITTITTVGYGDISAMNTGERVLSAFLMLVGVIAFSFATGSLSSIMSTYDSSEALYREKLNILNDIDSKYEISQNLKEEIKKLIKFESH